MATKEEVLVSLKAKTAELVKKHGKAVAHDLNDEIIPLLIDYATAAIPGQVDDMIASGAKPIIKSTLHEVIEAA